MSTKPNGLGVKDFDIRVAIERVPPEYPLAWEWFEKHGGKRIPRLPFGKGRPEGMPMPLARQAAIHCPSYSALPSKGAGKKRYALSVYSVGQSIYPDGKKSQQIDGTWRLSYHEQRGKDPNQDYNELLHNCMADGVPIGVMVKSPGGGYDVLGLAVVEGYDRSSHSFALHGPVYVSSAAVSATRKDGDFRLPNPRKASSEYGDTRLQSARSREEEYRRFRDIVYEAYEGTCAITEADIPEILDAAVIDEFEGSSLFVINNGILLRADVCRLFEADLLAIVPGQNVVDTSERLDGTGYARLRGCEVRRPREACLAPDETLIQRRYQRFARLWKQSAFTY